MDAYREIAPLYDWEHADYRDDIDFYLNIVREGPVLEAGVGTGRVMLPLVEAGFEVWGVDSSPAMLAAAEQRLSSHDRARLIQTSILELEVEARFATALMPLNFLWHLIEPEPRLEALRVIRRHLKPGGLLVIDLSNPLTMADRGADGELRQRYTGRQGDRSLSVYSAAWDDEAEQIIRLALTYDEIDSTGALHRSQSELKLRYAYRSEVELLLRLCRFQIAQVYGSYELEPYRSSSPRLIFVATAP